MTGEKLCFSEEIGIKLSPSLKLLKAKDFKFKK